MFGGANFRGVDFQRSIGRTGVGVGAGPRVFGHCEGSGGDAGGNWGLSECPPPGDPNSASLKGWGLEGKGGGERKTLMALYSEGRMERRSDLNYSNTMIPCLRGAKKYFVQYGRRVFRRSVAFWPWLEESFENHETLILISEALNFGGNGVTSARITF